MITNRKIRSVLYRLFRILYFAAACLYKPLSFIMKPVLRLHPRLENFASALTSAFVELIKPPQIGPEPVPDISSESLPEILFKPVPETALPDWLVEEWKAVHEMEPLIFPEKQLVENTIFYQVPESLLYRHYLDLSAMYPDNADHVFLVPWLVKGGADLVALNYVRALVDGNMSDNVVVIATLDAESPWKTKLPENVGFIEFGKLCRELSPHEQELLLARLLLQTSPKVVHNIHSDLGYRVFVKYGAALVEESKLFVSSFCIDMTGDGREFGYPTIYLAECIDLVEAVLSDNRRHLDDLVKKFAFDERKMIVNYQPSPIVPQKKERTAVERKKNGKLRILWAGRLDRQKRPDILIGIAEKAKNLPFEFHVYGSAILDKDTYGKTFARLENLEYRGPFNGLSSLPTDDYDLFLNTSQWDGLPNILMEAISVGLPVVSSDVGGINELIVHEKTGFLIDPFDEIDAYISCLKQISEDGPLLKQIADEALALTESRHSWDSFVKTVKSIPRYV